MFTNAIVISSGEAIRLLDGINKLVPEYTDDSNRYLILAKAGLLEFYGELKDIIKCHERLQWAADWAGREFS